ncbi:hypothetical protein Mgra_00008957 [Meloidogyne graminicola]|uniref:Uncharacterized protein n=1 Tax=Meloidogyne graminicola TaxID=189291 RepID=A0A8S9ZEE2_9BILA|nr:hypothetical protein Mgra_00008957 [Meloidogyne graminicola]
MKQQNNLIKINSNKLTRSVPLELLVDVFNTACDISLDDLKLCLKIYYEKDEKMEEDQIKDYWNKFSKNILVSNSIVYFFIGEKLKQKKLMENKQQDSSKYNKEEELRASRRVIRELYFHFNSEFDLQKRRHEELMDFHKKHMDLLNKQMDMQKNHYNEQEESRLRIVEMLAYHLEKTEKQGPDEKRKQNVDPKMIDKLTEKVEELETQSAEDKSLHDCVWKERYGSLSTELKKTFGYEGKQSSTVKGIDSLLHTCPSCNVEVLESDDFIKFLSLKYYDWLTSKSIIESKANISSHYKRLKVHPRVGIYRKNTYDKPMSASY